MEISRYKKPLVLFAIYLVFIFVLFLLLEPLRHNQDFSPLIPDKGFLEAVILLCILFPVSAIIGTFFGYFLSPIFLFAHKKTIGIHMIYGIQDVPQSEKFKKSFQAIFPALLAINLSMMVAFERNVATTIVGNLGTDSELAMYLVAFFLLMVITLMISIAVFAPAWFLMDAGIMFSNKKRIEMGKELPLEARAIGSWYVYILKGYAGISVIFAYYQFITLFLTELGAGGGELSFAIVANMLLLFPLMVFIAIASIPAIILMDITRNHRIKYVRNIAKKLGITDEVKVNFEKI